MPAVSTLYPHTRVHFGGCELLREPMAPGYEGALDGYRPLGEKISCYLHQSTLRLPGVERTAVTWAALLSLSVMVMHDSTVLLSEVRPPTCAPNGYQGNPRPLSPPRHAVSGPPAPPCVSPRSPRGPDRWQPPQVELIGQAARGKGGGPAGSVPQPAVVKRAEEKRAPPRASRLASRYRDTSLRGGVDTEPRTYAV